jgi:ATP-dependent Clp protease ATP-binding subunit ClpX
MYDLPAKSDVKKCIVTKNSILKGERPILVMADGSEVKGPVAQAAGAEKAESA